VNILLYNPDNGVTRNFMPHLWMFLLESLTPAGHKVFLIDGNAQPLTEAEVADFVRNNNIKLAGIGAMTRMALRAYRMADAIRSAGAKVVMGGPHVTEVPEEPLGLYGGPRHVDAVALGEADETWPRIVNDAANDHLQEIYMPTDALGAEVKPSLANYPDIPWERMDLQQFNLFGHLPAWARYLSKRIGIDLRSFYLIPIESGRGCPYGCDFCTVTGFFGDSIRFRTEEGVVNEMLRLKQRAHRDRGHVAVFFVDDNFAINVKRTKSLLKAIIAADAALPWVAQISINLLRDQELLDLIAASGGRWIFLGLESIDTVNLQAVNKGFNNPNEYATILKQLADRGIYAITSFIFGMDGDTSGVAARTLDAIASWPPGLPVFGLLTPYPATPLYERLLKEGRLTRPEHWLDFSPFRMAFRPRNINVEEVEAEIKAAWLRSYDPQTIATALQKIAHRPFKERAVMLFARLAFRGIYFPQMRRRDWLSVVLANRKNLLRLLGEARAEYRRQQNLAMRERSIGVSGPIASSRAEKDSGVSKKEIAST
jgi:radical SAM superfamily enzyme YgiQ (UPF0313 family)